VDAKNPNIDAVWIEINGSIEIGSIGEEAAKAVGLPAGPIRLAEGRSGPKGYGLAHIDDGRVQSLKTIGFESAQAAFVDVGVNWECAIQANEPNKVILVKKHMGRYLRLVVQVFEGPKGHFWSATTIIIGRRVRAEEIIYQK
jgi:hypothetical protein